MSGLKALLIALDQLSTPFLAPGRMKRSPPADWRWMMRDVRSWPRKLPDRAALLLKGRDPCRGSFESQRQGSQLPPEPPH